MATAIRASFASGGEDAVGFDRRRMRIAAIHC
jgi:hypothetical protein